MDAQPRTSITEMENHRPYADKVDSTLYSDQLRLLQIEMLKLQSWVRETGERVVIVFEGRDAAGKGGAIRRFTQNINPRGARIVALTKPDETEAGQWYFQRYIEHLPTAGELVFFDRSWYNRAGVEKVMGFCTEQEYEQFFHFVPAFETALVESGIHLYKLWFTISKERQRDRFEDRRTDPLRQWKFSPIDAASLDLWDEYTDARNVMFENTDTALAPWIVVNSNEKKRARLESMRHVLSAIPYGHKELDVCNGADPNVVQYARDLTIP